MSLTLISHFWNEEFLLPYWLRHHYPLFDHGVLLDYASTDRSCEIIRELAPRWEVRPSANTWFDARDVDNEVMAVEREFGGWKIVLNTTEFLLCEDLRRFVAWMAKERPNVSGIWPCDMTLVDPVARRDEEITDAPLYLQRTWGYHSQGSRSRLLHCHPDGRYSTGRHSSNVATKVIDDGVFIAWFGWCPLRYIKGRKMQIQQRISQRDRYEELGKHHLMNTQQFEANYHREASRSYDLLERHTAYRQTIERLAAKEKVQVNIRDVAADFSLT